MPPPLKPPRSAATALDRLLARAPRGTQAWVIGALGVGAALFLARWVGARQPLRSWLSLQLAAIWLWQAVLAAACASVGVPAGDPRACRPTNGRRSNGSPSAIPPASSSSSSASTSRGSCICCGPRSRSFSPALLLAIGAPPLVRRWRAAAAGPAFRSRWAAFRWSRRRSACCCSASSTSGAMSPDAINYDASWNHLVIAQDYAREGRIVPFPGDWMREPAPPRKRPQHLVVPGARVRSTGVALDDGAAHGVRRRSSGRWSASPRRRGGSRIGSSRRCGRPSRSSLESSSTTATSAARPITSSACSRRR